MEIEWDDNPPYKTLIEGHGGLRQLEDDLSEVVSGALTAPEACNMQTISNQIYELSTGIRDDNAKLLEVVISSTNNGGKSNTNKKPKKSDFRLNVAANEPLGIIYKYDNYQEKTKILSRSVTGTVEVYNLKLKGWERGDLFALCFKKEGVLVIGEKRKMKAAYIYECFIRTGISFSTAILRREVETVLYNFFASQIENTQAEWKFPTHQGWTENCFLNANNPPCIKRREFDGLPLYEKYFSYVKPTCEAFQSYLENLSRIRSRYARATVLLLPFYGIIKSLLAENTNLSPVVVNFVMLNEKEPREICELLQVFNRSEIGLNSLDVSDKEMDEIIKSSNDEVVLLDAMCEEEDRKYYKDKITNNALYFANVFLGKRSCKNRKKVGGHAALAVFSTRKIIVGGCINIIVTEDFWVKNRNNDEMNQSVEAVLTAFVEFVKMNYLEVKKIIRKQREQKDGRERLLAVMQEILSSFFWSEGFDMLGSARFSPNFNFKEILTEIVDTEELVENFRLCVKQQISKFFIEQKGKRYGKNYIYYDMEWLYFPTHVFDRILAREGLLPYKEEILLELYEQKYLRKDMEGFSRKLMISGKRFETYQVRRTFFDVLGELSIVDLGKETEDEG